jgi:pimeloyl-ACP methyl ester carboxylesterase
VLVDLRGHGRSTGDAIGYGAFEARDLSQVLDELGRRGLAGASVGVLGVSYGASTGLLLAARDPRVATVVALEPFSNAQQAVVEFAHGVAPERAARISAAEFDAALARAPKIAGFAWKDADVLAAMASVKVPVLFYHGAKDRWLSPENSRRLAAAAPAGSKLQILGNDDHILLSMRLTPIAAEVSAWFASRLSSTAAEHAVAVGNR